MDRIKDTSKIRIGGIPISVFNNLNDFDYASLYPSLYRQYNLAANTQIGMIIIPEQINNHENRQRDMAYSRGGQFLEDFQSHVWLEVATRWFNLADYTTLVHDVEEFFRTVMMPMYGLRIYNNEGHIEPIHFCDSNLPSFGIYFDNDIRVEHYEKFDNEKARMWIKHATTNPNQLFK